ncbi:hypothetical protein SAMN05444388_101299 [Flavobacterium johnsoniae]|uniref:Uncharacterized protein n=1 Tax=Flavobacterium johnsoniae TaxID=986 RepID=A0A1M5G8B9_FLAJO|nr:hypothetical protein SAMN05444388_101299 [Flavobacterium johnsoniae]
MRKPRKHNVYGVSFFYHVVNHVVIIFSSNLDTNLDNAKSFGYLCIN